MENVPRKPRLWRRRLLRRAKRMRDAQVMSRALVILHATAGRSVSDITESVGCVRAHVYRTVARFRRDPRWQALLDRRRDNGRRKADAAFDATVKQLVSQSPRDYDYLRPTWTRELLIRVAEEQTRIRVSRTCMGRVLRRIRARRGRPKPIVQCPLSERQKRRRLQRIRELIASLPCDEAAVYEDEVDIHLNPKIGPDWMNHGQQKLVLTPGQNQKAYLAGTLDARDGTLVWQGDAVKNSGLFIQMMRTLDQHPHYRSAKRIHVILDNYGIHKSHQTQRALKELPRIQLHFLPPYCPDENRIERVWLDVHANVTRNHRHSQLIDLCHEVGHYLDRVSPWLPGARPLLKKTA